MPIELVAFDMGGTTAKDEGNINGFFRVAFSAAGLDVEAADVDQVMVHRKNEAFEIVVKKITGAYTRASLTPLQASNYY